MFDRDSREVSRARHVVRATLRSWGLDDEIAALELVVSELVSNAIVHGTGQIRIDLRWADGHIRLEVCDDGASTEPRLAERDIGGWGLRFVDELSDSWGAETRHRGTSVWAVTRPSPRHDEGHDGDAG